MNAELQDALRRRQKALDDLASADADIRRIRASEVTRFRVPASQQDGDVGDQVCRAIVGALVDLPELRADEEVQAAIGLLTGDALLAANAAAPVPIEPSVPSADYLLWIMDRMEHPSHKDPIVAKSEVLMNAQKLRMRAAREKWDAHCASTSDEDESFSLLAEAQAAARKKHEMRKGR